MERLGGRVVVRPVSPLAIAGVALLVLALIAVIVVFAVVMVPLAIVTGLGYAGYRALTGAAKRKTNEILNRDDAGRRNVRVFRGGGGEGARPIESPSEGRSESRP